jgi:transposase InsO family protein
LAIENVMLFTLPTGLNSLLFHSRKITSDGGQFAPPAGGQFASPSRGQLKSSAGGQLRRFLHLVTDAYSKEITGFNVSQSLNSCGAVAALEQAIANRTHPKKHLIHHSDRGLQYCCDSYQTLLEKHKISCSMTESYDPYQNAVAERVNGILKHEFILGITIHDLDLMNKLIEESIYIYNNERPHWSCRMETPIKMHQQNTIKIRTYKNKNSTE